MSRTKVKDSEEKAPIAKPVKMKANQISLLKWYNDVREITNQIIFHTFLKKSRELWTRLSMANHRRPSPICFEGRGGCTQATKIIIICSKFSRLFAVIRIMITESCGEHASMVRIPLLSLSDSLMSESSPTCCITKQQKTYMCILACFFFGQKYPKTKILHLPDWTPRMCTLVFYCFRCSAFSLKLALFKKIKAFEW